jgi:hypothetical protein
MGSLTGKGCQFSGFSFFPALPWKNVEVPPYMPSVTKLFMAGIFEFPGSEHMHFVTFFGAVGMVLLSFLLLSVLSKYGSTGGIILLIEVAFSSLSFPIIKQLTDVFSCTRGNLETFKYEEGTEGRLCGDSILPTESCMDVAPDTGVKFDFTQSGCKSDRPSCAGEQLQVTLPYY